MLYECGSFVVTWPSAAGSRREAGSVADRTWVTWLAFTDLEPNKVEDIECKSDSFPRSILKT